MQANRIAGRVRGLGVCDVLRVELDPEQRAELDAGFAELRRRHAGDPDAVRLLAQMRRDASARREGAGPGMAAEPHGAALAGPAGLVLELVHACLADAVARLVTALERGLPAEELECVAAWTATALDCVAVDGYSFEPGTDPAHAW